MPNLFLVRHGQTAWNAQGLAQGHTDIELDELGLAQARALADGFQRRSLAVILTSDLKRARQTAEAVAVVTGASLETLPELRERAFGEWEGEPFPLVQMRFLEAEKSLTEPAAFRPPGGESLTDVWGRLQYVEERLQAIQAPTMVMTHGGCCGLLLSRLLKGTIDTARSFRFGNTAVTELFRRPDQVWVLERFACQVHLQEPGQPMVDAAHPS